MRVDHSLRGMPHIYSRRGSFFGQKEKSKLLKISADTWERGKRVVILTSKAEAHRSLISDRNPDRNIGR
jgi:hypothetical protein